MSGTDRKQLRTFGIALAVVCAVWFLLLWWRGHGPVLWLGGLSAVLALLAWLRPTVLGPVHRVWAPVAQRLATVLTWTVLAIAYYLVFTPFGLVMRLFGRDPLERKIEPERDTYWIRRDEPFDAARLERQF